MRFVGRPALFLLLLCAAPSPAPATPPILQEAFGATIVSTYPDGRQAKLWLSPSGAYAGLGRRGDRTSGHWRLEGAKLCLKQAQPPTLPFFRYCTPIPARAAWTAKAVTGETLQVRLVSGRAGAPPG